VSKVSVSRAEIEWELCEQFCPNCGSKSVWKRVDVVGYYQCACTKCREYYSINPWIEDEDNTPPFEQLERAANK